jgi:hypothetical protein
MRRMQTRLTSKPKQEALPRTRVSGLFLLGRAAHDHHRDAHRGGVPLHASLLAADYQAQPGLARHGMVASPRLATDAGWLQESSFTDSWKRVYWSGFLWLFLFNNIYM